MGSFGTRIGLGPNHVIVQAEDEDSVLSVLKRSSCGRALATVKPGARMRLLDGDMFWMASSSSDSMVQNDEFSLPMLDAESGDSERTFHVIVKTTCVEYVEECVKVTVF